MEADKTTLVSKLKDALSVRPGGFDPKDMAQAQDKIRNLSKENDLLKVTASTSRAANRRLPLPRPRPLPRNWNKPAARLDQARVDLAEQTEKSGAAPEQEKRFPGQVEQPLTQFV